MFRKKEEYKLERIPEGFLFKIPGESHFYPYITDMREVIDVYSVWNTYVSHMLITEIELYKDRARGDVDMYRESAFTRIANMSSMAPLTVEGRRIWNQLFDTSVNSVNGSYGHVRRIVECIQYLKLSTPDHIMRGLIGQFLVGMVNDMRVTVKDVMTAYLSTHPDWFVMFYIQHNFNTALITGDTDKIKLKYT